MENCSFKLDYTLDGNNNATFDFYLFPPALLHQLAKQANLKLFLNGAANATFQDERYIKAAHNRNTVERQLAIDLRLKRVPND